MLFPQGRIRSGISSSALSVPPIPGGKAGFADPTYGWALTSYVGVAGIIYGDNLGIINQGTIVPVSHITDGTSTTLMVSERPPSL